MGGDGFGERPFHPLESTVDRPEVPSCRKLLMRLEGETAIPVTNPRSAWSPQLPAVVPQRTPSGLSRSLKASNVRRTALRASHLAANGDLPPGGRAVVMIEATGEFETHYCGTPESSRFPDRLPRLARSAAHTNPRFSLLQRDAPKPRRIARLDWAPVFALGPRVHRSQRVRASLMMPVGAQVEAVQFSPLCPHSGPGQGRVSRRPDSAPSRLSSATCPR